MRNITTKTLKKTLKAIAAVLSMAVLFSCNNILEPKGTENAESKKAVLVISAENASRTILPIISTDDLTSIELKGTPNGGAETSLGKWETDTTASAYSKMSAARVPVDNGKWSFTLTAFADGNTLTGSLEKEIADGVNELSFNLSCTYYAHTKSGNIDVTLSYPDTGVKCVKAGLFDADNITTAIADYREETLTPVANGSALSVSYKKNGVPSGIYMLAFNFYADDAAATLINSYCEIVNVADDLTSTASRAIETLNGVYSITLVWGKGGQLADGKTAPASYINTVGATLPSEDDIAPNDGYIFAGWFENADFSGTAATGIAKGSTGSKTFYAKWDLITYTITYTLNDGTNSTDNPASYTVESETITLKEPTRAGCVFIGWYETETFDGNSTAESTKGTTGDKTLYARWRLVVVTLSEVEKAITELKDLEDGTYAIKVTGKVTNKDIYTIRTALMTLHGNNPNVFVDLDLSDATDLTSIAQAFVNIGTTEQPRPIQVSGLSNCTNLVSVKLPDSVISIDTSAFSNCTSLESIVIPDSVTSIGGDAFRNCTSLASIDIPDSVTSIGVEAFDYCTSLASIVIPDKVTSIGKNAFRNCTSLESIVIPEGVTSIGSAAFSGCTSLTGMTVKATTPPTLGTNAFNISNIKIYVPESSVDTYKAAEGWSAYADSITAIPTFITEDNAATEIGALKVSGAGTYTLKATGTFSSIGSITTALNTLNDDKENPSIFIDLDFSNATIDIAAWSFYEAKYLHKIILPKNITSIEAGTFCKCANLTTVDIPATVTSIGANAFDGCTKLENITIPSGVTSIGACAFVNCESIKAIEIPEGVTTIAASAFNHCPGISAITIPSSVTTIEDYAFCASSYQSITIPENATSIGKGAFQWCANLKTVTVNATTPPTLGSDAFADNDSNRKIYVPESSVDAYKTAWSDYADDIMAIE